MKINRTKFNSCFADETLLIWVKMLDVVKEVTQKGK